MRNYLQKLQDSLPQKFKDALREPFFQLILRFTIFRVAMLKKGELLDRITLALLRLGWGNKAWSAKSDYLAEMACQSIKTQGPILECGSGLSTLILGLITRKYGVQVWSLEHQPDWYARANNLLTKFQIDNVHLYLVPLRDYGSYTWYDPLLEDMPDNFRFVICDGPPEKTPGGRYGLLPVMGQQLASRCIILLDDVDRDTEMEIIQRWTAETGAQSILQGGHKMFAKITLS
jgi:predicted O-methyltransferase YrrM